MVHFSLLSPRLLERCVVDFVMGEEHHLIIYTFQVAQQTLQNRLKGQTTSRHKAAGKVQILVPGPY